MDQAKKDPVSKCFQIEQGDNLVVWFFPAGFLDLPSFVALVHKTFRSKLSQKTFSPPG